MNDEERFKRFMKEVFNIEIPDEFFDRQDITVFETPQGRVTVTPRESWQKKIEYNKSHRGTLPIQVDEAIEIYKWLVNGGIRKECNATAITDLHSEEVSD